ncbi:MAG: CinA family protein [Pseudomonadota bacterium]
MNKENILNQLHQRLLLQQKKLSLAESCTGGMLASTITERAGSSLWFDRAYITYSNQSKMDLLSVNRKTLEQFGAVSEQVAREMVTGCLQNSGCDYALSITGIAGPEGGSIKKPVGTVWFALAGHCTGIGKDKSPDNQQLEVKSLLQQFEGDRQHIREKAVYFALTQLLDFVNKN